MIADRLRQVCPWALDAYLNETSDLVLLLLDEHGGIQDCNRGFLRLLSVPRLAPGSTMASIGCITDLADLLPAPGEFSRRSQMLVRVEGSEYLLQTTTFGADEVYMLAGQKPILGESQILAEMSAISNELTNLTRELEKKNRELAAARDRIEALARTDALTGLANRRFFMETLEKAVSLAVRHGHHLSLVMADLDHFKSVNDTFGHQVGDEALKAFGALLLTSCRREDTAARYGGEEFICLLPDTDAQHAVEFAERVRHALEETPVPGLPEPLTASLGVAAMCPPETIDSLIRRTDEAMYEAKHSGRNQVQLAMGS